MFLFKKCDLNVIFKVGKIMFLVDIYSRVFLLEIKEDLEFEIFVD